MRKVFLWTPLIHILFIIELGFNIFRKQPFLLMMSLTFSLFKKVFLNILLSYILNRLHYKLSEGLSISVSLFSNSVKNYTVPSDVPVEHIAS